MVIVGQLWPCPLHCGQFLDRLHLSGHQKLIKNARGVREGSARVPRSILIKVLFLDISLNFIATEFTYICIVEVTFLMVIPDDPKSAYTPSFYTGDIP